MVENAVLPSPALLKRSVGVGCTGFHDANFMIVKRHQPIRQLYPGHVAGDTICVRDGACFCVPMIVRAELRVGGFVL